MRKLAELTPDDEPPIRGLACGPESTKTVFGTPPPSWIRCPYGDAKGKCIPETAGFVKGSGGLPRELK